MENTKKGIRLKEYVDKYGTPVTTLAHRCGLSFPQVYNILRGGTPTLRTALAIEKYTNGEVTCASLLPEEKNKEEKQ